MRLVYHTIFVLVLFGLREKQGKHKLSERKEKIAYVLSLGAFTVRVDRGYSDGTGHSGSKDGDKTDACENPQHGKHSTVYCARNLVSIPERVNSVVRRICRFI